MLSLSHVMSWCKSETDVVGAIIFDILLRIMHCRYRSETKISKYQEERKIETVT